MVVVEKIERRQPLPQPNQPQAWHNRVNWLGGALWRDSSDLARRLGAQSLPSRNFSGSGGLQKSLRLILRAC